ncbi:MAG: hypothetical protein H7Y27_11590, partial [Gemmatimonadaceae bacterium]|nr:hypothetical protein [Chitinophagaceae bacterium]
MKRIFYFLLFLLFASHAIAQDSASSKSITWNFSATGSAQTGYQLNLRADIQPGWKLFSTTMKDEDPNTRVRLDSASAGFASIISVIEKPT